MATNKIDRLAERLFRLPPQKPGEPLQLQRGNVIGFSALATVTAAGIGTLLGIGERTYHWSNRLNELFQQAQTLARYIPKMVEIVLPPSNPELLERIPRQFLNREIVLSEQTLQEGGVIFVKGDSEAFPDGEKKAGIKTGKARMDELLKSAFGVLGFKFRNVVHADLGVTTEQIYKDQVARPGRQKELEDAEGTPIVILFMDGNEIRSDVSTPDELKDAREAEKNLISAGTIRLAARIVQTEESMQKNDRLTFETLKEVNERRVVAGKKPIVVIAFLLQDLAKLTNLPLVPIKEAGQQTAQPTDIHIDSDNARLGAHDITVESITAIGDALKEFAEQGDPGFQITVIPTFGLEDPKAKDQHFTTDAHVKMAGRAMKLIFIKQNTSGILKNLFELTANKVQEVMNIAATLTGRRGRQ